ANIEAPRPSSESITQQPFDSVADSIRKVLEAEQMNSKFGVFSAASSGDQQFFELENEHLKVAINSKGGWFHTAQLKDHFKYPQTEKIPVDLWNEELSSMQLWLNTASKGVLNTDELYFAIVDQKDVENGQQLTMRLNTSDPESHIDYVYTLEDGGYTVNVDMVFFGMDRHLNFTSGNRLEWKAAGLANEKGIEWERQHSSVFFREEGKDRDYLGEAKEDDEVVEDELTWMSFKQNYFSALIINEEGFGKGASIKSYPPEDEDDVSTNMFYEANLPLNLTPASTSTSSLEFYFGPNDIVELNKLEVPEVSRIIDYGWWIFGWVNRNLIRPVFNWLSTFIGSAGIVILVLIAYR
ncbi:MAG: membrane protein insertase YidC, partial [Flavobacteriales bacterium]